MTRMERTARALYLRFASLGTSTEWEKLHPDNRAEWVGEARKILDAAYPEIHADPPTAWLAPWEATEMVDRWLIPEDWEKIRDAHLKQQPPGG